MILLVKRFKAERKRVEYGGRFRRLGENALFFRFTKKSGKIFRYTIAF
jgi:hypothetical protein